MPPITQRGVKISPKSYAQIDADHDKVRRLHSTNGRISLFLPVFLCVCLPRLLSVVSGMYRMPASSVSMMGGFLVVPSVVMLGSLSMMTGSMCVMLCSFTMMI